MNEYQMQTILGVMADAHEDLKIKLGDKDEALVRQADQLYELRQQQRDYSKVCEDRDYYRDELARVNQMLQEIRTELYAYRRLDPNVTSKASEWMQAHAYTPDFTYPEGAVNKIGMIKEIRQMTGFGLKEAKDFVEAWLEANPKKAA